MLHGMLQNFGNERNICNKKDLVKFDSFHLYFVKLTAMESLQIHYLRLVSHVTAKGLHPQTLRGILIDLMRCYQNHVDTNY